MYTSITYQSPGLEQIARRTAVLYHAQHRQHPQYTTVDNHHTPLFSGMSTHHYISTKSYAPSPNSSILYSLFKTTPEYHFLPDNFIRADKDLIFVGDAGQIQEIVEQAFLLVCSEQLPKNIKISILNEQEFRKIAPHPGVLGLSINRWQWGILSEIFVLQSTLGRVMLTLGHELGHVLTQTLDNPQDEEAKAYAFSLLWMKVIKERNIGNLQEAIVLENPAQNGLHNVGFSLVQRLLDFGTSEKDIYLGILRGMISCVKRTG